MRLDGWRQIRAGWRAILLAGSGCLLAGQAMAQVPLRARQRAPIAEFPVVPIIAVRADVNFDAVPDRLGDTVTVSGVVTAGPRASRDSSYIVFQDSTAATEALMPDSVASAGGYAVGDLVRVTGIVGQHQGEDELKVVSIVRTGSGPTPIPHLVMAAGLVGERYQGQLVEVVGHVVLRARKDGQGDSVFLRDRSGQIPVRVPSRFFREPDFQDRLADGRKVTIVGIAGQRVERPPYTGGYRLKPRELSDFRFAPHPPYTLIALTLLLLAGAGAGVHLARRRRYAERRAAEMAVLVAERERAEEAARESEARYRMLFEDNPLAMWVFDRDTLRFLAVNHAAVWRYGYTLDEFLSMKITDIRPPSEVPALFRQLREPRRSPPQASEWTHLTKDGRRLTVQIAVRDIVFADRPARLVLATDVTEQRRAETQRRESEQVYRSLVNSAPYGIYRSSREGRFTTVNQTLVTMLGYESEAELLAIDMNDSLYNDSAQRDGLIERSRGMDRVDPVEVEWRRKDGRLITVRLTGRRVRSTDSRQQWFEMFAEDVTSRRALEQQLRQAQKMEAVGQLTSGMAHDFNNLLTTILATTGLLEEQLGPDSEAAADLHGIRESAQGGAGLTRKLLAFGRQQPLDARAVDLAGLTRDFAGMMRRVVREDIAIQLAVGDADTTVRGDPGAIEQVLLNLVTNARDAMPEGGVLRLQLERCALNRERSHLYECRPGEYVVLAVSDTGVGMDAETQRRIFEPFFTTKPAGVGTGLGMVMVYGLVKQHQGFLRVDSEPGRGTTVRVFLPAGGDADVGAAVRADVRTALRKGEGTILLVEDDERLRGVTRRVLERHGYDVLTAADGEEAVRQFRGNAHRIDLVVSDIVLPRLGGARLLEALRAIAVGVKVLFTSGFTEREAQATGALQPGQAFLAKPWTVASLLELVHQEMGELPPRAGAPGPADPRTRQEGGPVGASSFMSRCVSSSATTMVASRPVL